MISRSAPTLITPATVLPIPPLPDLPLLRPTSTPNAASPLLIAVLVAAPTFPVGMVSTCTLDGDPLVPEYSHAIHLLNSFLDTLLGCELHERKCSLDVHRSNVSDSSELFDDLTLGDTVWQATDEDLMVLFVGFNQYLLFTDMAVSSTYVLTHVLLFYFINYIIRGYLKSLIKVRICNKVVYLYI